MQFLAHNMSFDYIYVPGGVLYSFQSISLCAAASHPAQHTVLKIALYFIYLIVSYCRREIFFSDISNLMYSLGHLLVEGLSVANDSPTFTKKNIKFIGSYFPITNNITIVFEFRVDWTILSFIDDWLDHLPGFPYISFVLFYQFFCSTGVQPWIKRDVI